MLQKIKYSDEQIEDKILTRTLIHLTEDRAEDRILLTNSFISLITTKIQQQHQCISNTSLYFSPFDIIKKNYNLEEESWENKGDFFKTFFN